MEFVIQKEHFLRELSLVQGIVERKTTMPILANLLLRARPEGLEILATDLEVGLKTRCEAAVSRTGESTVQARKLFDIVRSLPEGEIQISRVGDLDLGVECERSRFLLRGLPAADFPQPPEEPVKNPVRLPAADLREMVARVIFAVTVDDPVYSLNGALFSLEGKQLSLVATDGHRLAFVRKELKGAPEGAAIKRVVHRKTLLELMKVLMNREAEEELICGEMNNHLLFHFDRSVLTSRFLEKSFPAYEKVLPKFDGTAATVERSALSDALKRVSLLSSERSRAIRLELSKGRLKISSNSPEVGEAEESVSLDYAGEKMAIGFNARYLLDFTEAVGGRRVRLFLKDANTQGLFTGVDEARSFEYLYVVMPMQLQGQGDQ
ncbi:MAG: DNA polymerase III subunit beta [Acidobacteriota bacterium]